MASITRQGFKLAVLVSGALALVFMLVFIRWSGIPIDDNEWIFISLLIVSATLAGAITGGGFWRLMAPARDGYSLWRTVLAGILTIPLANLATWLLFFALAGLWNMFAGPQDMIDDLDSRPVVAGLTYLTIVSTLFTGLYSAPLSVLGLIGVTLWGRRKLDEAPAD